MSLAPPDRLAEAARAHAEELYRFLRRRTGDPEAALDLRQEVFLRLARVRPGEPTSSESQSADPPAEQMGDLRAYLFRTARNLLVDRQRQAAAQERLFAPAAPVDDRAPSQEPAADQALEDAQALDALREALAELPERPRLALLWHRLDGLTLREIGQRLGVSESMAARYVTGALAHCQTRLGR
jgi:RNA polymerase sigma-70 factor (ECF subfamily)